MKTMKVTRVDELLKKLRNKSLTKDEKIELRTLLQQVIKDKIKTKDNWGALYVQGILAKVR